MKTTGTLGRSGQFSLWGIGGGFVAALAGCVGVSETVLPSQITYVCAGNKQLQVARAPDARIAAVVVEGNTITLMRAASAAQEKYSDGDYTLYLDGEKAILEYQSRVLFGPCTSPVPLPQTIRQRY
jgi:membrane-bound inhibitor of C-type lysozyme